MQRNQEFVTKKLRLRSEVLRDISNCIALKKRVRENDNDQEVSAPKVAKALPPLPIELDLPDVRDQSSPKTKLEYSSPVIEACSPHMLAPPSPESPSLENKVTWSYKKAESECKYLSPTGTRLAAAKILREFGDRIDTAINRSLNPDKNDSTFAKLRKQIHKIMDREAKFDAREDVDIHTFRFEFEKVGASVTAHHKIYKSGITSHQVLGITSYESISAELTSWTELLSDRIVAETMSSILSGQEVSNTLGLSKANQTKFGNFMAKLTFLLFCTESAREPASIAVNAMFLDLVKSDKSGKYKMSDITKLPMSAENAVAASRTLSKAALGRKEMKSPVRPDPKIHHPKVQKLLNNYESILLDWLEDNAKGKISISNDIKRIADIITEKIEKWFDIKIKPFRHCLSEQFSSMENSDSDDSASCSSPESMCDSPSIFGLEGFSLINDHEMSLAGEASSAQPFLEESPE